MSDVKMSLPQWQMRVGPLPDLIVALSHDLYVEGRAPVNALAEAVRTLDKVGRSGMTQSGSKVNSRTVKACREAVAGFRAMAEAKDSLEKASTPEPWSTSKTSNWVARLGGLPDYIQHVSHGIMRSGSAKTTSQAISMAISRIKVWAAGGGNVDAGTKAAAAKALAEWEKLKAKQHAVHAGKEVAEAAHGDEDLQAKLLHAAERKSFVIAPVPDQAVFAKRYGNRMEMFESTLSALKRGQPLAEQIARGLLEAPEGLPRVYLVEELVARKAQTLLLLEAMGYGTTPLRAKAGRKGSFHGMHGVEHAVKKRRHLKGEPEHPAADAIKNGTRLTEAAPPAAAAVGGGAAFDEAKHPRAGHGQFGSKGGAPAAAAPAGGGAPAGGNGNGVADAIRQNDPQFQKEMEQTSAYAKAHPAGASAPMSGDQLQSLGYSNDPAGIAQFQKDEGMPVTGRLDSATMATIQTMYANNSKSSSVFKADSTGIAGGVVPVAANSTAKPPRPKPSPRPHFVKAGAPVTAAGEKRKLEEAGESILFVNSRSGAPLLSGPPSGWTPMQNVDGAVPGPGHGEDFDFDEDGTPPPNLRDGDGATLCSTCPHFSPGGFITPRRVQGGCMLHSVQVDKGQVCDDWTTLVPGEVRVRVYEGALQEAERWGTGTDIVEARAALQVVQDSEGWPVPHPASVWLFEARVALGLLGEAEFSTEQRQALAKKGRALKSGAYPIKDLGSLDDAITAWGRSKPEDRPSLKRLLMKMARKLGAGNDVVARIRGLKA